MTLNLKWELNPLRHLVAEVALLGSRQKRQKKSTTILTLALASGTAVLFPRVFPQPDVVDALHHLGFRKPYVQGFGAQFQYV